ncbi:EAL domain-containing response regulator [Calothrix sp. FACHB-1219]|uniref:two-component system response regulator n=1 Tax=unclassified Calothrix TaxID=2619626 RepID=UPI001685EB66|nr:MULTISPECIES: EAL domain-containing response regulator [unclassified Calothrix]MBD2204678.1 EAL domain-containing response regulator [Calothrix sp. FACHB-168]MBD2216810.1 EAL domain-containing response regulator [Calothrix sp. FACHB-1219]
MTKILVIEDEELVRENILDLLEAEDFDTLAAANGKIGLNLALSEIPDLILCDMMMPELDGYGVLTTLRQDPSTATIPFIFLTAKSAKADFRQGMDMGADDYLTKPFTRAELLSAIVNRLEKQAALKKHLLSTQSATTASSPKMQLLEVYLQRVVKQDKFQEFELYYQPIVDIGSGKIIAAENVLIWQSPELGSVPSLEFIEVAEAKGLILPLENWVFTSICEQIKMWQYNLDFLSLTININVSSSLFYCPQFIEDISAILLQKKVAPERIEIEISESIVMQNLNRAIAILQKISALGVKIALDDFGIGYSSLTNLKELPLNTLKIGRYYIHNVNSNQEKAALTIAVMKMAHNLNLRVIAEGVDTEAELDFLRQNNCDAMQGFLLSRPLPAAELENFF